jgi:hypothetical protein
MGFDKPFRANHAHNEFVSGSRHVNGVESFWSLRKKAAGKIQWPHLAYFGAAPQRG